MLTVKGNWGQTWGSYFHPASDLQIITKPAVWFLKCKNNDNVVSQTLLLSLITLFQIKLLDKKQPRYKKKKKIEIEMSYFLKPNVTFLVFLEKMTASLLDE